MDGLRVHGSPVKNEEGWVYWNFVLANKVHDDYCSIIDKLIFHNTLERKGKFREFKRRLH